MVILLLSVLAAVAIPNFIDFRTDAKNAAIKSALGTLRSAISIATAAIALKEDPSLLTPKYPTAAEMLNNTFNGSHPVLSGTTILENSMVTKEASSGSGIPANPWSASSATAKQYIYDCTGDSKGTAPRGGGGQNCCWCYSATFGQIWAQTKNNGGTNSASAVNSTENWY